MPRPLLPLSLLLCLSAPLPAVTLSAVPTAENAHYRITVSALRGARVPGLVDRRPGKEIVYRDAKGFGGLFDDRMNFIDAPYRSASPGAQPPPAAFSSRTISASCPATPSPSRRAKPGASGSKSAPTAWLPAITRLRFAWQPGKSLY